jgi:hypothetical protein
LGLEVRGVRMGGEGTASCFGNKVYEGKGITRQKVK